MSVKSQLERVRVTLPEGVTLVAVSKTHPIEAIKEAYEGLKKIEQELYDMIGHLQTNKIKYIAPFVAMIHSVDSERLAEAIQVQAAKCNRTIDVLLEIHVAEEESKSGWAIEDLRAAVASGLFERLPNVRVRGVMGIATNTDDAERIVSDFVQLRIYKEELAAHFGEQFDTLSMGMSDDYPAAIAAGSTMVRIGSTIFGERDYSK